MSTFSASSRQKRLNPQFFTLWTSKCARATTACTFSTLFRHLNLHGPRMVFVHFDLDMCFAPQWRALFRHRNLQKWSGPAVFCTFWLGNVLRATTACTFLTSQLPKVVRDWGVLYILTWKCASRHLDVAFSTSQLPKVVRTPGVLYILTWKCASRQNGVQFFISHLASWLRTRRFSEPTFRPSGAPNHWKNTVFRDFPTCSHICIFFLLIFSLLTLLTSAFQLSILSEVSLLNFLRSYHRMKFRSQTSDNMDRWKAEQGRAERKGRLEERRSEEKE